MLNNPHSTFYSPESQVFFEVEITWAEIVIDYDNKQTVTLTLDVRSRDDSLKDENLTLLVSNNLHRAESDYLNQNAEYVYEDPEASTTYYFYRFTQPTKTARLIEKFEGNLFGTVKSSVNLNFDFVITHIPTQQVPVEIVVRHPYKLNINYVSPRPIQESAYFMKFSYLQSSNDFSSEIYLSATDPAGISLEQSRIFFVGVGLGVVFSLVSTIIYDLIRFFEDKQVSNKPAVKHRKKNFSGSLKLKLHAIRGKTRRLEKIKGPKRKGRSK